jgi:hypothetical protein
MHRIESIALSALLGLLDDSQPDQRAMALAREICAQYGLEPAALPKESLLLLDGALDEIHSQCLALRSDRNR